MRKCTFTCIISGTLVSHKLLRCGINVRRVFIEICRLGVFDNFGVYRRQRRQTGRCELCDSML